ncbi:beta-galactosidase [Paenibacillus brevis]|uniref:Beta-galactosidase n=1 Tax=Paenibacillus brevis TaxID=2841508 RepID=A0ABS6FL14_9BACL|nr:beta-galactosidase [Paenibacillus brevis]MBU5670865.1 beta-galactosidase [Paenibacillus brevis]
MNILLFYDQSFPFEGKRPEASFLTAVSTWAEVVDAEGLASRLQAKKWDTLVWLHGAHFPKEAWTAVRAHLQSGGGLLYTGGAPFRRPAVQTDTGDWRIEREQVGYHQMLDIHDALPVDVSHVRTQKAGEEFPVLSGKESWFGIEPTWGLTLHPSKTSDIPAEMGSCGPMDSVIIPLLIGVDATGRERAASVVLMEQNKGIYAGGRWVLVNQEIPAIVGCAEGADVLRELALFAGYGVTEIWLKPNYACYELGEQPLLTLQLQALSRTEAGAKNRWSFELEVRKDGENEPVWTASLEFEAGRAVPDLQPVRLPVKLAAEPGLYRVIASALSAKGERRVLNQAFWGMNRELLQSGEPLKAGRDYFERAGKPVPIVGMTYMTSDVSRKFLQLPNVERWERDMGEMSRAGINLIRTGIWTGYRQIMFADGHAVEDALRAIDAFILTAKRFELEVTFTFFSFAPESWEGVNPYLDPRSLEAQKRFIAAIVSRQQGTTNVHWDLINEPSLFDPARIFEGPVTARDIYEQQAWSEWLNQRYGGDLAALQERWNMTPEQLPDFASAQAPDPDDKVFRSVVQPKKWARWLDFTLFTMDMHNRWASELIGTLRRINPEHLATVGQDEGICSQRPSPSFYAQEVDYTTVHSWWQNDHLAWDGLFTKTPGKPNLVQETGIMHIQHPDGRAKRTEAELRNILERKYAYAFSTGGAGAVQWIWNINYYMNNANESNIGALRADGTQKPEADVSYDFGSFMGEIGHRFRGRKLEEVAVVYPYSNDFSNQPLAYGATTKAIRTLAHVMNVHPRGIGEYHLSELRKQPAKLIIVPSAHNFDDEAFADLIALAEQGATILWNGPIRLDAHWGETADRLREELGELHQGNVLREETLELDGAAHRVAFGERKINTLVVERPATYDSKPGSALSPVVVSLGAGKLIYNPLPLELNERDEPIIAAYRHALAESGVASELEWLKGGELPGIYGRKLSFEQANLYIFVSEFGADAEIAVRDPEVQSAYRFIVERERTVMFATDKQGELLAVYRPDQVHIERV